MHCLQYRFIVADMELEFHCLIFNNHIQFTVLGSNCTCTKWKPGIFFKKCCFP